MTYGPSAPEPIGVDHQPAIVCHGESAHPDSAAAPVHLDICDDRRHRPRALGIGDAAAGQRVALAVGVWRGTRLPPGALGRRLDDGDVARRLQIAQAKRDRVPTRRGCDLVDKGFTSERSKQVGQFLRCNAGLAQDGSQRAALEIPIMVRNSD